MPVHCRVPYVLSPGYEPLLNVRHAWAMAEGAAGAAVPHRLSLDTCQGNTTSENSLRAIGASIQFCGSRLRKGEAKTMGMTNWNVPWVRLGESVPVWCVIGSWERPELGTGVRCCFGGRRACGNKSGKHVVWVSPAPWQQDVWQEAEVKATVWRNGAEAAHRELLLPGIYSTICLRPPPVLAAEQRSASSRSVTQLFSLRNSQTFLHAMLVFWGVIFKSPACFLRSIVFSTIFFCRFKIRSSFISLSPGWDFLFFSSCLKKQKEAMKR